MKRFENKTVIVTGGSGGIGAAICERLAREGAHVVVCDINLTASDLLAEELCGKGYDASVQAINISDPEACQAMIAEVVASRGGVDVLCNNAGINRRGDLLSLTEEDWSATFSVNLNAMFHLCRAVLPHMINAGGGAIVNTASQWGLHPAPGHIAYNVSKAAVASFTQSLARDYAPQKIRVNAVCPGEVRTPLLESNLALTGRSLDDLNALVPFGRIGEPAEIAALIAFLASDEAPYMCGSLIEITGAQAVA